jgi:hypothetical protein
MDDLDDESLRDRLDEALATSEDEGKAVKTLDAMLGEPQVLIPVAQFGEVLYAIIKEDTVVTVLPKGHGEEILQRGQAMEQRVASGHVRVRGLEREREWDAGDRWDGPRRRWRKEAPQPVVIERIVRSPETTESIGPVEAAEPPTPEETPVVVRLPEREAPAPDGPVAAAIAAALEDGRRKAAIAALRDVLSREDREASLLPLWNALADQGIPQSLTIGDLIDAVR